MQKLIVNQPEAISLKTFLTQSNEEKIVCVNIHQKENLYDDLFVLTYWEKSQGGREGWVFQLINSFGLNGLYPSREEAIKAALKGYPKSEFFVFDSYLEFIKWFNVESGCGR